MVLGVEGVKPLRGGVAPTPPVPNSCENRCNNPEFSIPNLPHSQERVALLRMGRVLAAHRAAKTRPLSKVQDLSLTICSLQVD